MSEVEGHVARVSRVEEEVGSIKQQVTRLETQMRGFGDILTRIEQGVAAAQERQDHEKLAARLNPMAIASILITIITILVGGAWTISGQLARQDERSQAQEHRLETIDARQWQVRGSYAPADAHP